MFHEQLTCINSNRKWPAPAAKKAGRKSRGIVAKDLTAETTNKIKILTISGNPSSM